MNNVGIYYAFWEREWNADYINYISKVKSLGFDTLEIAAGALTDMTSAERIKIADAAKQADVKLTYCIGLPACYDVSSPDESIRKNGVKYVSKILDCMHEMGGDTLGGIIYSCWPMQVRPDYDYKCKLRSQAITSLKELLKKAEEYDINYCLEIVNRFEQCVLNTAEEGVAFAKELESPKVKLLLDTFHMNIEEDSFTEAIHTAGDLLGHFHIGEANRKTPGVGRLPWNEIFTALKDINYKGNIVMEPFIKMGGQVGKDILVMRDLSNNADESRMDSLAADAAAFVKKGLKSVYEKN